MRKTIACAPRIALGALEPFDSLWLVHHSAYPWGSEGRGINMFLRKRNRHDEPALDLVAVLEPYGFDPELQVATAMRGAEVLVVDESTQQCA